MSTLAFFGLLVITAPLVVFSIFAFVVNKIEDHVEGRIGQ